MLGPIHCGHHGHLPICLRTPDTENDRKGAHQTTHVTESAHAHTLVETVNQKLCSTELKQCEKRRPLHIRGVILHAQTKCLNGNILRMVVEEDRSFSTRLSLHLTRAENSGEGVSRVVSQWTLDETDPPYRTGAVPNRHNSPSHSAVTSRQSGMS